MSEWQWFIDYYQDACWAGDYERRRMLELHDYAFDLRETDPDRTLAIFAEGHKLAEQLGEPWWVLLFDQWRVHGIIYYKNDFRHVLDEVVHNVLKLRKPVYAQYPQRLWIWNDLVTVYLNVDPVGYSEEIEQALAQLEAELKPQTDDSTYLWLENKVEFFIARQRWPEALELSLRGLNLSESDADDHRSSHYLISIYGYLCLITYAQRQWHELQQWAVILEEAARRLSYHYPLALAQMWQALAAQQSDDGRRAARLLRSSLTRKDSLRWPACRGYYDAWCHYYLLRDNLEKALEVREKHYEAVINRGQLFSECYALTEQCRLCKLLDQLDKAHLAAAREAARRLRKPERYLAEIERIERGEDILRM